MVDNTAVKAMRDEIKKMYLFKGREYNITFSVTHDFEKAKFYAFEKQDYKGDAGATWNDIRENQFRKVMSLVYQDSDYKEIAKKIREAEIPEVNEIQYSEEGRILEDEIYTDLLLCMRCRMIMGKKNKFFEKMLEIYKLGGWPCGWDGTYPEGKFIVFFPCSK